MEQNNIIFGPNWKIIPSTQEIREEIRNRQRSKHSQEKECIFCHQKFDYGYSSLKSCLGHKILVQCKECGNEFELDYSIFSGTDQRKINEALITNSPIETFCSKECKYKYGGKMVSKWCEENPGKLSEIRQKLIHVDENTGDVYCGNDNLTKKAKLMRERCKEIEDRDPEKKRRHRQKCIEKAHEYWKNNPELHRRLALNNLEKLNNYHEQFCNVCNKITLHDGYNNCTICVHKNNGGSKPNLIIKNNILFYKDYEWNDFCNKIKSGELDINNFPGIENRFGIITYYRIDPLTDKKILKISNFQVVDNVVFYKDYEWNDFCNKIKSGELDINSFPGIENRFEIITYNRIDPLTDKKILKISDFQVVDNVAFYYDQFTHDYILWSEYKSKFKTQKINNLPEGFVIYPTFRAQDSKDWKGSLQAFEQNLIDNEIGWFTYIKFYINENNKFKPLVCGKSGSKLVNASGSDVSFSTDINDGPARRFLQEEGFEWCKTQIAILKCDSEEEAYEKELFYIKELNLFGS